MKTYTMDQLVTFNSEQIDQIQKSIDNDALAYLEEQNAGLSFLSAKDRMYLEEYYTDTMERILMDEKAIVSAIGKEEGADIGGIHVEGPFISPKAPSYEPCPSSKSI